MKDLVYISTPINDSNLKNGMGLIHKIGSLCEELGFRTCTPCLWGDLDAPDPSQGEVIEARSHPMDKAKLCIAYLGIQSHTIGFDLRIANDLRIPIILLYENGKRIEPFVRGINSVYCEIVFSKQKAALAKLRKTLVQWRRDRG